ncbi:DivIVA domain-containing protein [Brachybacterium hainanense]|uniref:DivIVA domain-containing protein n=1 Tax=Brachybacterium hainanense TaxID=1541174 RepID=A0ABV6RGV6_9MICO
MEDPRFTAVRFAPGYDMAAVDDFVDRVRAALEGRAPMTAQEALDARFPTTRLRSGYSVDEVDLWIDEILARLEQG